MSHFRALAAAAVLAVGGLAMSAPAQALVIWEDNFNRLSNSNDNFVNKAYTFATICSVFLIVLGTKHMSRKISKSVSVKSLFSVAIVSALAFLASPNNANAFPITFKVIKADDAPGGCAVLEPTAVCGNSTVNIAKFISGDVTNAGGGTVSIKIALNASAGGMNAPANAELKEIYFENPGSVLGATITPGAHAGSTFLANSPGACAGGQLNCNNNPPGANQVNPNFNPVFQAKFLNSSDNGINVGEMAVFNFTASFAAVQTAFITNTLRIGIHAQSLPGGTGESDSFISMAMVTNTPEPATLSLLGLGVLGAGIARRRRNR